MLEMAKAPDTWIGVVAITLLSFFGGGGFFKWMQSRAAAQPAVLEQSQKFMADAWVRMETAFDKQGQQLDEAEAALKSVREERHQWRNAFDKLRGYTIGILRYEASIIVLLEEVGIDVPPKHSSINITIEELLRMPVPEYEPHNLTRFGVKGSD